jgi:curved DNA-binding protein CbpA
MTSDKYKNYYETLGLNSSASKKEINIAFRELSHLYHPDNVVGKPKNIQEIAAKKFNEISQARKILIDYTEKEIQYDQSFRQQKDYENDCEYAIEDDETEYSEEEVKEEDNDEYNEDAQEDDVKKSSWFQKMFMDGVTKVETGHGSGSGVWRWVSIFIIAFSLFYVLGLVSND